MNVPLTPDLEMWIQDLVASGKYRSDSDLVLDAVRRMKDDLNPILPGRPFTEDEMITLIQQGLDSGPAKPLNVDALLERIEQRRNEIRDRIDG